MSLTPQAFLERERKFGRLPGMRRVVDLFDDKKNEDLDIHLVSFNYFSPTASSNIPARRDLHWAIVWGLGSMQNYPCYRLLHIVTETFYTINADGNEVENRVYTNWGPHTKSMSRETCDSSLWMKIGRLSLEQRQVLESIATNEPVEVPNGVWNCQHWIKSVLQKAIQAGLFNATTVAQAISTLSVS